MDVLDDKALRKKVQSVVEVQSQANRGKQRVAVSRGNLSNFAVGEYVVVARVLRSGSTTKFIMTWTGPWRVVVAQRPHVYGVQDIVSEEVRDIHVARMRLYAAAALAITAELKEVFQRACTQGEFEMAAIVDMANAQNGSRFEVEVEWGGFDKEENTWENLAKIWDAAPQFAKSDCANWE